MSQFTSILTTDDFKTGETRISQNQFEKDNLKSYIKEIQEEYLKKLLGDSLYLELGAELPTPTTKKLLNLLDGVVYTYDLKVYDYTGLKRMLQYLTYYYYTNDQDVQNTIIGNVAGQSRNSENLTANSTLAFAEEKFNKAIDYFKEAQLFIQYNNSQKRTSTGVTDNSDNTYTVAVTDTLYMVTGAAFTINGELYKFGTITENTSFTFTASSTGLNFTSVSEIKYNIFTNFKGVLQNKSFFGGMIS
jgi:rhamnogalacturonyl hydrolase YesR